MVRTLMAVVSTLIGLVVALPLVLLGLPFWLIAGVAKLFHRLLVQLKAKVTPWQQLIEYSPGVGWKPKANMRTYAYADKPFYVTTDQDGWRGKSKLVESDIVVFGDSYAFGYGVSESAYFAELNPGIKIKCVGVNGYNMVQALLWMRRLAPQLSGKLIVWFVYHGNDLFENLQPNLDKYAMPFVRSLNGSGAWEIVTDHISEEAWRGDRYRDYYSALAQICTPTTSLSRRAFSACEYLIREGSSLCERAGAQLMVMSIPDITQISDAHVHKLQAVAPDPAYFDPNLPDASLHAICERLGIGFVQLRDYLCVEDHKEHDAHWNERGHRRVAELMEQLHRRQSFRAVSSA